jgi:hypothetical protein
VIIDFYHSVSEEIGFEALSAEYGSFEKSHLHLSKECLLSENAVLNSRIHDLGKCQGSLERKSVTVWFLINNGAVLSRINSDFFRTTREIRPNDFKVG